MPGPVYEIKTKDKQDFPKWSVGKEKRFAGRSVGTPGPGAYQEKSFTDAGPKFTSRVKPFIDQFKMKTKPGPGFYDPQKPQTQVHYSMSKKLTASSYAASKNTPGPGTYGDERVAHYASIPGSKIGKDVRKQQFLKTPSHGKQAPGNYNIKGFANNPETGVPKFGFGTSTRKEFKKCSQPGPGSYEFRCEVGNSNSKI